MKTKEQLEAEIAPLQAALRRISQAETGRGETEKDADARLKDLCDRTHPPLLLGVLKGELLVAWEELAALRGHGGRSENVLATAYDQALTEVTGSILSKYAADKIRDRAIAIAVYPPPSTQEQGK